MSVAASGFAVARRQTSSASMFEGGLHQLQTVREHCGADPNGLLQLRTRRLLGERVALGAWRSSGRQVAACNDERASLTEGRGQSSSLATLFGVEDGDGIVEGRDIADVRP